LLGALLSDKTSTIRFPVQSQRFL